MPAQNRSAADQERTRGKQELTHLGQSCSTRERAARPTLARISNSTMTLKRNAIACEIFTSKRDTSPLPGRPRKAYADACESFVALDSMITTKLVTLTPKRSAHVFNDSSVSGVAFSSRKGRSYPSWAGINPSHWPRRISRLERQTSRRLFAPIPLSPRRQTCLSSRIRQKIGGSETTRL